MSPSRRDRRHPMARAMARRGLALGLVAGLLLAGCGGPAPQPVEAVPDQVGSIDLPGPLRVHYNLLPTLALGEAVAREYGVERRADTALLDCARTLRAHDAPVIAVTRFSASPLAALKRLCSYSTCVWKRRAGSFRRRRRR